MLLLLQARDAVKEAGEDDDEEDEEGDDDEDNDEDEEEEEDEDELAGVAAQRAAEEAASKKLQAHQVSESLHQLVSLVSVPPLLRTAGVLVPSDWETHSHDHSLIGAC